MMTKSKHMSLELMSDVSLLIKFVSGGVRVLFVLQTNENQKLYPPLKTPEYFYIYHTSPDYISALKFCNVEYRLWWCITCRPAAIEDFPLPAGTEKSCRFTG
jgi:hypothetical protein